MTNLDGNDHLTRISVTIMSEICLLDVLPPILMKSLKMPGELEDLGLSWKMLEIARFDSGEDPDNNMGIADIGSALAEVLYART